MKQFWKQIFRRKPSTKDVSHSSQFSRRKRVKARVLFVVRGIFRTETSTFALEDYAHLLNPYSAAGGYRICDEIQGSEAQRLFIHGGSFWIYEFPTITSGASAYSSHDSEDFDFRDNVICQRKIAIQNLEGEDQPKNRC